jgi:hypothetical protein
MRCRPHRISRSQMVAWLVLLFLSASLSTPPRAQALPAPADPASLIEPLGSFGGRVAAVAVQGNLAYIVQGAQFVVLDITSPAQITRLGAVSLPGLVPADRVRVAGTLAFLISFGDGLTIVDVSDPHAPRLRGTYSEPSVMGMRRTPQDIVVQDNLVYLAMEHGGLRILDVSNPDQPLVRNPVDLVYYVRAVELVSTHAYLLTSDALDIYDVADPAQPVLLSSTPVSNAVDLEVDGTYAYISSAQIGIDGRFPVLGKVWLDVVAVNDGRHLTPLSHLEIETPEGYTSLHIADGWAYLGVDDSTALIDIHDPSDLVQQALFPLSFGEATIVGLRAYIAGALSLRIVDLHNPDAPVQAGVYSSLGDFTCVRVVDDIAYVVEQGQRLLIFDVHNPAQPQLLRHDDDFRFAYLCSAEIDGDRAYTDYQFFDLSDRVNPKLFEIRLGQHAYYDMAVAGDRLYAVNVDGLSIFDISVPQMPQLLGILAVAQGYRVAVAGQTVYVAEQNLTVVDASDPTAPRVLGTSVPFPAPDIVVATGDYVIVDGNSFLGVFDVRNPTRPRPVTSWGGGTSHSIRYADGLLYEPQGYFLTLIDIREPSRPNILLWWDFMSYSPEAFDVQNDVVYVVDVVAGLRTYQLRADRLPPKLPPLPPPTDLFLPIVAHV